MPPVRPSRSTCTVGERAMSPSVSRVPVAMLVTAPAVVQPRQKMQRISAGKLPLAAIANASDTMKATFCPLKAMPSTTATAPRATVATRATRSSSSGAGRPCRTTLAHRSCDSAAAPESVSPATTARIVANATAAMNPRNGCPPRYSARSGAAMLPPLSTARIASGPTNTIAPKPSTNVIR